MKYYIKVIENKNVVTKKYTEKIKNNGKKAVLSLASLSQRYNINRKKNLYKKIFHLKTPIYKKFSYTNILIPKEIFTMLRKEEQTGMITSEEQIGGFVDRENGH